MSLGCESYVCSPDERYPLYVTAKRYWWDVRDAGPAGRGDGGGIGGGSEAGESSQIVASDSSSSANRDDDDDVTLIFLHSTSFCKESWQPTIRTLLELISKRPKTNRSIKEAWSIDCPNHGEAAVLNGKVSCERNSGFYNNFTCDAYAHAAYRFLTTGACRSQFTQTTRTANTDDRELPGRVILSSRKLIGIGHSLGGVAISTLSHLLKPPFISLILIEPMLSPRGRSHLEPLRYRLVRAAYERRDVWSSREDAMREFRSKMKKGKGKGGRWDERSVKVYVDNALRPHPASIDTDTPYDGVTLCLPREAEAAMYKDFHGPTRAIRHLESACARMPVHIVLGTVNDFVPKEVHDAILYPYSERRFANVTKMEGVGHLIPQESPDELARVLYQLLLLPGYGKLERLPKLIARL